MSSFVSTLLVLCYSLLLSSLFTASAAGTIRVSKRQLVRRQQSDILQSSYDSHYAEVEACYDFIIVGAGPAGMVIAERLTENENVTVLLLEGGEEPTIIGDYKVPGNALNVLGSVLDSAFVTLPEQTMDNRQMTYHRGRTLGGTTAINGLVYGRGSSSIFDNWEALGNPGWSWSSVFPMFKKSTHVNGETAFTDYETYNPDGYSDGPLQLSWPPFIWDTANAFVQAVAALGIGVATDQNTGNQTGVMHDLTMIDATFARSSAFDNYYQLAKDRPNLQVLTLAPVQLITTTEEAPYTATGVVFSNEFDGKLVNVTANKEVIVCGGVFQGPQLLMLSGIGPSNVLESVGVPVKVDSPGVGQNLQDHFYFSITIRTEANGSISDLTSNIANGQAAGMQYNDSHTGVLTAPPGFTHGFQSLNASELASLDASALISTRLNQSHIEYYYEPTLFPSSVNLVYPPKPNESYFSITAGVLAPLSRGSVTLQSNSLTDYPYINLSLAAAPADQKTAVQAFKNLRTLLSMPEIQQYALGPNLGEVAPGPSVQTDEEILAYIQKTAYTAYHACCTNAMLPQADGGVLDSRLRVYGVAGLRVADFSIGPFITDNHPSGPTYMIGEMAAQMIAEDWGFAG